MSVIFCYLAWNPCSSAVCPLNHSCRDNYGIDGGFNCVPRKNIALSIDHIKHRCGSLCVVGLELETKQVGYIIDMSFFETDQIKFFFYFG